MFFKLFFQLFCGFKKNFFFQAHSPSHNLVSELLIRGFSGNQGSPACKRERASPAPPDPPRSIPIRETKTTSHLSVGTQTPQKPARTHGLFAEHPRSSDTRACGLPALACAAPSGTSPRAWHRAQHVRLVVRTDTQGVPGLGTPATSASHQYPGTARPSYPLGELP